MIKKMARIFKDYPRLLLDFGVLALISSSGHIIFLTGISFADIGGLTMLTGRESIWVKTIVDCVLYTVNGFVIMTAFLLYIYEVLQGKVGQRWFARGVRKYWLSIGTISIALMAVTQALNLLLSTDEGLWIFGLHKNIAFFIYVVFACFMFVAVAAEDNIKDALKGSFTLGKKYCVKMLGAFALFFLISTGMSMARIMIFMTHLGRWLLVSYLVDALFLAYLFSQSMEYYIEEKRKNPKFKVLR